MAGGGGGNSWIYALVGGGVIAVLGMVLHGGHVGPGWLSAAMLAIGGLAVVFGSCEAMIKSVEGIGQRLGWNEFVAGTMGGLASNIPEVVMLGFVVKADPRVAFVVVMLTLHVGAMAFGLYCGLLPRDKLGAAKLPTPMVKLSTDLYACAGGVFLAMGVLMVVIHDFGHPGQAQGTVDAAKAAMLLPGDLYVIGGCLLFVECVAIVQLVRNFAGATLPTAQDTAVAAAKAQAEATHAAGVPPAAEGAASDQAQASEASAAPSEASAVPSEASAAEELPSIRSIVFYGVLGIATSVVGGHAVGDFADILVKALQARGVSEMIGALLLSVFACAGVFVMIAMAHSKKKYDIALSGASGAVSQVPFVVMPLVLILIAAFNQLGVTPPLESGGALSVDLETTSVVIFGFPTMLIMWKSIQDDGQVNWVETASMMSLFGIILYFLAVHG